MSGPRRVEPFQNLVILSFVLKQRREHSIWTEIARPQFERSGLRYASDLKDEEWNLIMPLLPPVKKLDRPRRFRITATRSFFAANSALPNSPAFTASGNVAITSGSFA